MPFNVGILSVFDFGLNLASLGQSDKFKGNISMLVPNVYVETK